MSRSRAGAIAGGGVGLAFVLIVFQEALTKILGPIFGFFDEALIVILVLLSLFYMARKPLAYELKVYIAFFLLLLISSVFGKADVGKGAVQLFIHFKLFFIFVAVLRLFRTESERLLLQRSLDLMLIGSILGVVLNLLFQDRFFEIFDTPIQSRGGVVRVLGLQLKPNDLAIFLGAFLIHYVFRADLLHRAFHKAVVVLTFLVLVLLNGSRVGLAAIPLGLMFSTSKQARVGLLVGGALLVLVSMATFGEYLDYIIEETSNNLSEFNNIDRSQYIRGIMIYYGFVLAFNYFPIGSGAATFGSILSEDSVVYSDLNLMSLRFFQDMEGVFDSNLATVLGEFGFFGLALFVYLWCLLAAQALKLYAGHPLGKRYVWAVSLFALLVFITNPFFMYQYNSVVFVVALMVGPRIMQRRARASSYGHV